MTLSREDSAAIALTARRLGLDPYSFGGLLQMESGIDPNIWGGAGGQYRGLIQFGPGARKEVGLPGDKMSIQQQLPFVEKYFQQRGYKPGKDPGENITRAYRTVLVGNPFDSGTDSFGTNSDKAAARMRPGGDLYKTAMQRLGGDLSALPAAPAPGAGITPAAGPKPEAASGGDWSTALFGDIFGGEESGKQEPATKPDPVPAFRPADLGALPVALMDTVEPGRMAGDRLRRTADNDPFLAAALANSPRPEPVATPVPSSAPAQTAAQVGGTAASGGDLLDGEVDIVSVGKRLQGLGFKVAENPNFGDGRVGKHSPNSHHYAGHALDLTIQPGSPLLAGRKDSDWQGLTSQWGAKLKAAFPGAEIFHPGDDPVGGHNSHIHLALPGGRGRASKLAQQLGLA